MTTPTIKLELTLEQVNGILQALGKAPAEFSLNPIALIQSLAGPQAQEIIKQQEEQEEKKDEQ